MSSSLGIYIESNLIKYAKVTKDKEFLKIDAFGVKFYDKIEEAIDQIISETFSYKIPISINLSEEMYQYFYFFNLLNKNDLKKAIETEFTSDCYEKGKNRNALETRYALVPDIQDKEKIKAIYISANKTEINKKLQEVDGNLISGIYSLPMSIPNVADIKPKENVVIVNMEEKTTLTTIVDQKIYNIDTIDENISTILSAINDKENSYSKAYEICKNTTIYTMEGKELVQEETNAYLEDIMPTLYNIVEKAKDIIDNSLEKIDRIYITGTGCVINNIDLYFQEYFQQIKCEILKPYFIQDNLKISIKDYIEVNSAIALAMQNLGYGIKDINFKNATFLEQIQEKFQVSGKPKQEKEEQGQKKSKFNFDFSFDLTSNLTGTERWLLRTIAGIIAFIIIYSGITIWTNSQTNKKIEEAEDVISSVAQQIQKIEQDKQKLNNKTSSYQKMTENLKNYSDKVEENLKTKNVIPMLLTRIMNVIPKGVTITSIENTTNEHIVINAQSTSYDLLGFFKASMIVEGVLDPSTVVSTSGVKQNGIIKIVIEGDLP